MLNNPDRAFYSDFVQTVIQTVRFNLFSLKSASLSVVFSCSWMCCSSFSMIHTLTQQRLPLESGNSVSLEQNVCEDLDEENLTSVVFPYFLGRGERKCETKPKTVALRFELWDSCMWLSFHLFPFVTPKCLIQNEPPSPPHLSMCCCRELW